MLTQSTKNWLIEKTIEDLKEIYGSNYIYMLQSVETILTQKQTL
jgi:hypothetical protein